MPRIDKDAQLDALTVEDWHGVCYRRALVSADVDRRRSHSLTTLQSSVSAGS